MQFMFMPGTETCVKKVFLCIVNCNCLIILLLSIGIKDCLIASITNIWIDALTISQFLIAVEWREGILMKCFLFFYDFNIREFDFVHHVYAMIRFSKIRIGSLMVNWIMLKSLASKTIPGYWVFVHHWRNKNGTNPHN